MCELPLCVDEPRCLRRLSEAAGSAWELFVRSAQRQLWLARGDRYQHGADRLDAATATKAQVVGALLIIGIADNLTDSLSVHIYQEAEHLAERQALRTTVCNFFARLVVSLSFAFAFLQPSPASAIYAAVL